MFSSNSDNFEVSNEFSQSVMRNKIFLLSNGILKFLLKICQRQCYLKQNRFDFEKMFIFDQLKMEFQDFVFVFIGERIVVELKRLLMRRKC